MKKSLILLLFVLCSLATWAQDFSAVAPTGQTLYFKITSDWYKEVEVACPANGWSTSGSTKPTGDLTIPSSVTHQGATYSVAGIGDSAFSGCEGLTSVVIPNSVIEIKVGAFTNCSALTNIIIPHSVTYIHEYAFSGCSSLTHIIIPNSVTTIDPLAFENIGTVYYRGTASGSPWGASQIITTTHTEGSLTYESPYKTMVISCSPTATNVTIPNSVFCIENEAFKNCSTLTSVTISNSVTTIGEYAFSGCSSLTAITFPDSVTTVEDYAFSGCTGLKMVSIGESVTKIGDQTFEGCTNVDTMYFNAINLRNTDIWYIDDYGFRPMHLDTLVIGNKVRTIPEEIFIGQSNLTSLTIPNSVISINNFAFDGCSRLSNITFGDSLTTIGMSAFADCIVTTITLPNSLTSIANYVFYGCSNLRSVTFGNSLTSIGPYAFMACDNLDNITIPNSVETIGDNAFYDGVRTVIYCGNATGAPWGALHSGCFYTEGDFVFADNTKTTLVSYIGAGGRATIPNTVTTIADNAFLGCSTLNSLTIPNSVTTIGVNAFNGVKTVAYCGNATGTPWGALRAGCFYVDGDFVFTDNTKSTLIGYMGAGGRVTLPNSVTTIEERTFSECTSLTSITIPNSVTTVGERAFSGCSGLQMVSIGESVTQIGNFTFEGCTNVDTMYYNAKNLENTNDWFIPNHGFRPMELDTLVIGSKVQSLPKNVFYKQNNLTGVTLPNSVTIIGDDAFSYCRNLSHVFFGDSLTSIGMNSFYSCNITNITFPNSLTNISSRAFMSCGNLDTVTLPSSVTTIGVNAFSGVNTVFYCGDATGSPWGALRAGCFYVDGDFVFADESKTTLVGYIGAGGGITIPNTVTTIADRAFLGCSTIDSLTIPNSVTTIGVNAFSGVNTVHYCGNAGGRPWGAQKVYGAYQDSLYYQDCDMTIVNGFVEGLTTANIPDGVTAIASNAFKNCSTLTSVTISNTVTTIADSAFLGCSTINSLTIPNSVTTIGVNAFSGVDTVHYCGNAGGRPWGAKKVYGVYQDSLYYQDCDMTIVNGFVEGLTTANIPDGVTAIAKNAFKNCSTLTSVTISNTVTTIADSAFLGCSTIDSLTIPNSVTTIGVNAFSGVNTVHYCGNAGGRPWGAQKVYGAYQDSLYYQDCDMTIVNGFVEGLTTANIPNGVTAIAKNAFLNCTTLTSVTIPPSVTTIENHAFEGCTNVTTLYYNATDLATNNIWHNALDSNNSCGFRPMPLDTLVIGDNVETLPQGVFYKQQGLTTLTIPPSVSRIETAAFYRCSNVTTLNYNATNLSGLGRNLTDGFRPMKLQTLVIGDNVQTLPDNAFYSQTNLTNVSLPNSLTSIGASAFYNDSNLTNLTLPESLTSIGASAFHMCTDITTLDFPESLATIGDKAFYYCTSLSTLTIPETLTAIGSSAFSYCKGLTSVSLPESMTSISDGVFQGCSGLTSVTLPNAVTTIGADAFRDCTNLVSISIPNSVTAIGDNAFMGCSALTHISLPNSITIIENNTFNGCSALTDITIPQSVTTIDIHAFEGCSRLSNVTIPNSVTTIGVSAFQNCTGIASVVIGKSVNTIGNVAFEGCTSLKTVYNLSKLNIQLASAAFGYGYVAFYANRVLDSVGDLSQCGFTNYGTGSNTLHQINNSIYTVVDEENDIRTNIPRSTIPANFIYYDGVTATNASGWRANEIVLTDDTNRFDSPVYFIADTATYSRSFTNGNRSTLYLPFTAAIPDGFEVYDFTGFDNNTLTFSNHDGDIAAYTPYLVGYDLSKADNTDCTIGKRNAKFPQTVSASYHPVEHNGMTFSGVISRTEMTSTNNYGYSNGFFVQSGGHAHVNPFRCYFTYHPAAGAPQTLPATLFIDCSDNSPMGIGDVESPDRQNSIRYSNDVYDLMGRLVRKNAETLEGLPRGIYIWKGKKVVCWGLLR